MGRRSAAETRRLAEKEAVGRIRVETEAPRYATDVLDRLVALIETEPDGAASVLRTAGINRTFIRDFRRGKTGPTQVTFITVLKLILALDIEPRRFFADGVATLSGDSLLAQALRGADRDCVDVKMELERDETENQGA